MSQICESLFKKWKADAHDRANRSNEHLIQLQNNKVQFIENQNRLTDTLSKLSKKLFDTEHKWNFLMKLQVFYL